MSYSSSLGRDAIANAVLQESYPDIIDLLNVDEVAPLLFARGRITVHELDRLQSMSIFADHKNRRHILYYAALANKGQEGLDAFLRALCETAGHAPHAQLLDKLCMKLKAHGFSPSTVRTSRRTFARGARLSVTNLTAMESSEELPSLTPTDCSDKRTPEITVLNRCQQYESCSSTATSGYGTGTSTTSSLLERCYHSSDDMIPIKLILLGNVGVGKTSLMHKFLNNWFSDSMPQTVAGERKNCYLRHTGKGVSIDLAIWDTAGQERFDCVSPSYYRNIDAVIMVFDMTDNELRKSLHAVREWNKQLHQYTSKVDVPIILAGNKCKSRSPAVNKNIAEHAEHLVTELSFNSFMEVSAKEDFGVEELFEKAITLALQYHNQDDKNVVTLSNKADPSRRSCLC